jgi:hypothetical protein
MNKQKNYLQLLESRKTIWKRKKHQMTDYKLTIRAPPLVTEETAIAKCKNSVNGESLFTITSSDSPTLFWIFRDPQSEAFSLVEKFSDSFSCEGGNVIARPSQDNYYTLIRAFISKPNDILIFYQEEDTLTIHGGDGTKYYLSLFSSPNQRCVPSLVFAPKSASDQFVPCTIATLVVVPSLPIPLNGWIVAFGITMAIIGLILLIGGIFWIRSFFKSDNLAAAAAGPLS